MLLTRRQAKRILREATGRSMAFCSATVEAMPKTKDGRRWKVSKYFLDKAIADANKLPERKGIGIRDISERGKEWLRQNAA